jgi:hypothetical protein
LIFLVERRSEPMSDDQTAPRRRPGQDIPDIPNEGGRPGKDIPEIPDRGNTGRDLPEIPDDEVPEPGPKPGQDNPVARKPSF